MFKSLSLKMKMMLVFIILGLGPLVVVGWSSINISSSALSNQAFNQLVSIREIKKAQIETFFYERKGDMAVLTETVGSLIQSMLDKFIMSQTLKRNQLENYFNERYVDIKVLAGSDTVNRGQAEFTKAFAVDGNRTGGEAWKKVEAEFGPWLTRYRKEYGYYDIFLINKDGTVVYTVAKESDLGQNLVSGKLKDSPLGFLFRKALKAPSIQDFEPYAPSNGDQAAFVGAPLMENGELVGVVAAQLSIDQINSIVQERTGMGRTGESYLIGRNKGQTAYRSDRVIRKARVGQLVKDPVIDKALAGESGQRPKNGPEGSLNLEFYTPLKIKGLEWALFSTVSLEEVLATKLDGSDKDYFTKYTEEYGYYDLFLIGPDGNVFYTVAKESDYRTNMVHGKYAESGLGRLVRKVMETKKFGLADFSPYAPSNGEPAAFIAQPVLHNGQVRMVVALQLSIEAINRIMQQRQGLGRTGESYLVGPDGLMRSDSFLDPTHHTVKASFADPVKGSVKTEAAKAALAGRTDQKIIIDYNGNPVLSAYTPVSIDGVTWALLAEIDEAEAFSVIDSLRNSAGLIGLVAIIIIIIVAILMTRHVAGSFKAIFRGLKTFSVAELDRTQEQCSDIIGGLVRGSGQVNTAAEELAEGASEQAASLEESSASLEEISAMVQSNAGKAAEADIVSRQVESVMEKAGEAMNELDKAMEKIGQSGGAISNIVKSIDEIAFQTNLLALNAAVEAARAGEAGAGFAVVADEVRALALRSAEAVKSTQVLVEDTVQRIKQGTDILSRTRTSFAEVSEASAKSTVLATEIAAASNEQSIGVDQLNTTVGQMDQVVQANASAAEELSAQAEEVNALVRSMMDILKSEQDQAALADPAHGGSVDGPAGLLAEPESDF